MKKNIVFLQEIKLTQINGGVLTAFNMGESTQFGDFQSLKVIQTVSIQPHRQYASASQTAWISSTGAHLGTLPLLKITLQSSSIST